MNSLNKCTVMDFAWPLLMIEMKYSKLDSNPTGTFSVMQGRQHV